MPDRLVTIAEFANYIEAEMARQLLADYDIESVVVGDNASILYCSPAIEMPQLQVFESQSVLAKDILDSQKQNQTENSPRL
jgi:hypothetical protein